jgi:glycosyltransferase involved in cell wall biosynthesis
LESAKLAKLPDEPPTHDRSRPLRILIVAEHSSAKFGGEAILPLHYFRGLRGRGLEVWLITHARTQDELLGLMPSERDRIEFIPDTWVHRLLNDLGRPLPATIAYFTVGWLSRWVTQFLARGKSRHLVRKHRIDVVHQPIPVSPRETSILHHLGAPVVMGPMNGGLDFPPSFRRFQGRAVWVFTKIGRWISDLMNRLLPGKLQAQILVVANQRTREALPPRFGNQIVTLLENGIDPEIWKPPVNSSEAPEADPDPQARPVRFVFAGRLVDWKRVDLLVEAFRKALSGTAATLDLLGDGPMRPALVEQVKNSGLESSVRFQGWLSQREIAHRFHQSDVFVLASLYECGGAVVMEAMAAGLPVIATAWGGPADYVDSSCGILVPPTSRESLVEGLASAMTRMARSASLRREMGRAAREKALGEFTWDKKVDRMLEIYSDAVRQALLRRPSACPSGVRPG